MSEEAKLLEILREIDEANAVCREHGMHTESVYDPAELSKKQKRATPPSPAFNPLSSQSPSRRIFWAVNHSYRPHISSSSALPRSRIIKAEHAHKIQHYATHNGRIYHSGTATLEPLTLKVIDPRTDTTNGHTYKTF